MDQLQLTHYLRTRLSALKTELSCETDQLYFHIPLVHLFRELKDNQLGDICSKNRLVPANGVIS